MVSIHPTLIATDGAASLMFKPLGLEFEVTRWGHASQNNFNH